MPPLIPIETLSFYFTKTGFSKFKQWFYSIDILKPISQELDALTNIVDTSNWLEDKLRKECFHKIRSVIIRHVENTIGIEPDKYFQNWIDSIQQYCFQGGYGYLIQYSGNLPHHWCVRCEHYDKVKEIPLLVKICGMVCDKYINLADKAEMQYWGN